MPANFPVELDERGYMLDFTAWTEEVAALLAAEEGIAELSEDHWTVIHFLRGFHAEHGVAPMVRVLCKETGFNLARIYELFENGPAKGACKIAGLPRPDSCV
jgi:TusE/DsrC/DsvC family sulfur relay protein